MRTRASTVKMYRAGATFWPFLIWALAAGTGAVFAEREALARPPGLHRWTFHGLFAAGLLLGPISFAVQWARRCLVRVKLDPSQGLILAGDRLLPWSEIEGIEHRPAPLKGFASFIDPSELGEIGHVPASVAAPVVLLHSLLTIFYYLLLPPLTILSPWHPRVTVLLRDGGRLVFRDLERDGEFVFRVRKGIRP